MNKASVTKQPAHNEQAQQNRQVWKAVAINLLSGAILSALTVGAVDLLSKDGTPELNGLAIALLNIGGLALLYSSYRLAFWSLRPARLKPKPHAAFTAGMLPLQTAGGFIGGALTARAVGERLFFGNQLDLTGSNRVVLLACLGLFYLLAGLTVYLFARRRASRKLEGFEVIKASAPRISSGLRPWMLGYGCLATFIGFMTIASSVTDVVDGKLVAFISIVAWLVELPLFWLAYQERVIGYQRFWQLFAPLVILADIIGIFVVGPTEAKGPELLVGTIFSLGLSLPLYYTVYWYAYRFLPEARTREIKHMKREDLFQ